MSKRDAVDGLAARLVAARAESGLSQSQVSASTGAPQPMISLYERGRRTPTVSMLLKLARAYGINPADLLPGNPPKKPPQ